MNFLNVILGKLPEYKEILKTVNNSDFCLGVTGVSLVNKAHLIYGITNEKINKGPSFCVVPNDAMANDLHNILVQMGLNSKVFPEKDFVFHNVAGKSSQYEYARLSVLNNILGKTVDVVIVSVKALVQKTIAKHTLKENIFSFKKSDTLNMNDIKNVLLSLGYKLINGTVTDVGQFSVRGEILDVYPVNYKDPIRIDFWGDVIEEIFIFNSENQRKLNTIDSASIVPCSEIIVKDNDFPKVCEDLEKIINNLKEKKASAESVFKLTEEKELFESKVLPGNLDKFLNLVYKNENATILDYIGKDNNLFLLEIGQIDESFKNLRSELKEQFSALYETGDLCEELGSFYENKAYFLKKLENTNSIYLDAFVHNSYFKEPSEKINLVSRQLPAWDGRISNLVSEIKQNENTIDSSTIVLAGNEENAYRVFIELQKEGISNIEFKKTDITNLENKTYVTTGTLPYGFKYIDAGILLITYKSKNIRSLKNKENLNRKRHTLTSLTDLTVGDYVVHVLHGIGRYCGISSIESGKVTKDYIKLEYAGGDIVYVPVTQLDLIDKYIGVKEGTVVPLNKLGTSDWKKAKARAKSATKDIAKELTKLYAQRMQAKGHAFLPDDELQKDFEMQFEYEETSDQKQCILEIKEDMQSIKPMDRLLCGDVGFGKTEVAMRAIFKCVSQGKQCAMLVPTTILAWQHYQNMLKRFEKFPIKIELLSRFRTFSEQKKIIKDLKDGKIDIIIGTHRLVQKDISYKDLGLVIIDEEQRFGVSQKEKFKNIVKNVDILTLSATPIPRTLHMAMSGIRDMSVIREAPQNRFPVQTYVLEHDQNVILDAIKSEIKRDGQVYYLHNDVASITKLAIDLQNAIPDAHVAFAHGKMAETELSIIWQKMVEHNIDVLVCTTIIETGVDIPNVNTLIIDNADYMGLSQLHQIRGRVGRSNRKAYAYFTFRKNRNLSETAQKRLEVIKDLTEFGSGFKIAKRDLELRGAGNLLSSKQHGHIADVGYDMYLRLLEESIEEEKSKISDANSATEKDNEESVCSVELEVQIHIPESYIPDDATRLDIYREISSVKTETERSNILSELYDRFGTVPKDVITLLDTIKIKNLASKQNIEEIRQVDKKIIFFGTNIKERFVLSILNKFKYNSQFSNGKRPSLSVSLESKENVVSNLINILEDI